MRKVLTVCGLLSVFAALALAESWEGRLLDSSCYDKNKSAQGCEATSTTSEFILEANGKVFHLTDSGGMIKKAVQSRADRAQNPNSPAAGAPMNAKVTGTLERGDKVKVENIEIQ